MITTGRTKTRTRSTTTIKRIMTRETRNTTRRRKEAKTGALKVTTTKKMRPRLKKKSKKPSQTSIRDIYKASRKALSRPTVKDSTMDSLRLQS
jgi:hypothetical protein